MTKISDEFGTVSSDVFIDLYLLDRHVRWPDVMMCVSGSDVVGFGYSTADLTLACDWLLLCGPVLLLLLTFCV